MSRIGKQTIVLPEKVTVTSLPRGNADALSGQTITVTGPLGAITRTLPVGVMAHVTEGTVSCTRTEETSSALWGTASAHVSTMVEGVTKGFTKRLQLEGIGFRAEVAGSTLTLSLGFSHPVRVPIPAGIKVVVEKNSITVTGVNKELVGQFAATTVLHKKPEPYKGKGILYEGQYVRRKQGKRSAA